MTSSGGERADSQEPGHLGPLRDTSSATPLSVPEFVYEGQDSQGGQLRTMLVTTPTEDGQGCQGGQGRQGAELVLNEGVALATDAGPAKPHAELEDPLAWMERLWPR